jgi:hypothetical protein
MSGKARVDECLTKMEEIVKEWLHNLFGDDDEGSGPSTTSAGSADATSSNIVQYDDQGRAVDVAKMIIESKGVKIGSLFMKKGVECDDRPTLCKLVEIHGDGICVLHEMDDFGSEKTNAASKVNVVGKEFLAEWKLCEKKFKFLADHKGTEVKHHLELGQEFFATRIRESMLLLAHDMDDYEVVHRVQPRRGLFSKKDYEVGKLLLSPFGSVVKWDPTTSKGKPSERTLINIDMPDSSTSMYILHPQLSDDDTQNNFGAVQSATIEDLSNMKIVHREVRFLMPTTGKLRISGHEHVVKIPCFQNYKAIKANDELTYYVPKVKKEKPKKKEAPELKLDTTLAKKAKK